MLDVICVGDVAVDHIYRVKDLPKPDQKVYAEYLGRFLGGTTYNTAYALNALGSRVMFVTTVGDDKEGKFVKDQFKRIGMNFHAMQSGSMRTPVTLIMIAENGEKVIYLLMEDEHGKDTEREIKNIPLDDAKVIFSTFSVPIHSDISHLNKPLIISLEEPTLDRYPHIFDWASKNAHTLILDRHAFKKVFNCDVAQADLSQLMPPGEFAIENLIVTRGANGSIAYCLSQTSSIKSHPFVVNPVDTTGAGDIFSAAYIHAHYIKNQELEEALRYANAMAAASCEEQGTGLSKKTIERATIMLHERR